MRGLISDLKNTLQGNHNDVDHGRMAKFCIIGTIVLAVVYLAVLL